MPACEWGPPSPRDLAARGRVGTHEVVLDPVLVLELNWGGEASAIVVGQEGIYRGHGSGESRSRQRAQRDSDATVGGETCSRHARHGSLRCGRG